MKFKWALFWSWFLLHFVHFVFYAFRCSIACHCYGGIRAIVGEIPENSVSNAANVHSTIDSEYYRSGCCVIQFENGAILSLLSLSQSDCYQSGAESEKLQYKNISGRLCQCVRLHRWCKAIWGGAAERAQREGWCNRNASDGLECTHCSGIHLTYIFSCCFFFFVLSHIWATSFLNAYKQCIFHSMNWITWTVKYLSILWRRRHSAALHGRRLTSTVANYTYRSIQWSKNFALT